MDPPPRFVRNNNRSSGSSSSNNSSNIRRRNANATAVGNPMDLSSTLSTTSDQLSFTNNSIRSIITSNEALPSPLVPRDSTRSDRLPLAWTEAPVPPPTSSLLLFSSPPLVVNAVRPSRIPSINDIINIHSGSGSGSGSGSISSSQVGAAGLPLPLVFNTPRNTAHSNAMMNPMGPAPLPALPVMIPVESVVHRNRMVTSTVSATSVPLPMSRMPLHPPPQQPQRPAMMHPAMHGAAPWQSPMDAEVRRKVLIRIMVYLKNTKRRQEQNNPRLAGVNPSNITNPASTTTTTTSTATSTAMSTTSTSTTAAASSSSVMDLARRLERVLYRSAASLAEYENLPSLKRRMHALCSSIVNGQIKSDTQGAQALLNLNHSCNASDHHQSRRTAAPLARRMESTLDDEKDRRMIWMTQSSGPASSNPFVHTGDGKRFRGPAQAPFERVGRLRKYNFYTIGMEWLSGRVYGYLEGRETLRHCSINRFTRQTLPAFVEYLGLSCNTMKAALEAYARPPSFTSGWEREGFLLLERCINLKYLEVASLAEGFTFGRRDMHAAAMPMPPSKFILTHLDHEEMVQKLSRLLQKRVFVQLKHLGLVCLFSNNHSQSNHLRSGSGSGSSSSSGGELNFLLDALELGVCPSLEALCLGGNYIGDVGMLRLSNFFLSGHANRLKQLDLRRNFIGENGIAFLCNSIERSDGAWCHRLEEICLGGNILTDSCVQSLVNHLRLGRLPELRFLGLDNNYLTPTSVQLLGQTVGALVCPKIRCISYRNNTMEDEEARRVFSQAFRGQPRFPLSVS